METDKREIIHNLCGEILKIIRDIKDLTLIEAEDITGIDYNTISKMERGLIKNLNVSTIKKYCEAYEVDFSVFEQILKESYAKKLSKEEILSLCEKHFGLTPQTKKIKENDILIKLRHPVSREILSIIRQLKGFTLREVEETTGIQQLLISRIETGFIKRPKLETIKQLCEAYEIEFSVFEQILEDSYVNNLSKGEILSLCEKHIESTLVYNVSKFKKNTCGKILNALRKINGMSQTKVEELTGIERLIISRIETGFDQRPKIETIKKLCEAYKVDFSLFEQILKESYANNLSSEEIFSLCEKYLGLTSRSKLCNMCGEILSALRNINMLTLREVKDITGINYQVISMIETGSVKNPKIETIKKLCEAYEIEFSEFEKILEYSYKNQLSQQENLFLCVEYQMNKQKTQPKFTKQEENELPGKILKAMRVAQGKTAKEVCSELNKVIDLSKYESGEIIINDFQTLKTYTSFFNIPDKDLLFLYDNAIKENLSYLQLLYLCLIYDINRKDSKLSSKEGGFSKKPRYETPVYEVYQKLK